MKKILAITLVLLLIAAPAFAAAGDIYNASDKTLFLKAADLLTKKTELEKYISDSEKFLIEFEDGKLYKAEDIAAAFTKNPANYKEELKASGKGIEKSAETEELKVLEITFKGETSAEVSLNREGKIEEVKKLEVKPEGTFENFEGKKKVVNLTFKEKLKDGDKVKVGDKEAEYKKPVLKKVTLKVADAIKDDVEIVGASVEEDSFIGAKSVIFEKSFKIKNKSTKEVPQGVISCEIGSKKINIEPGKEVEVEPKEGETLDLKAATVSDNPTTVNSKFEGESKGEEGKVILLAKTAGAGKLAIKAGTKISITAKVGSTVYEVLPEKTYGDLDAAKTVEEISKWRNFTLQGIKLFDNFESIEGKDGVKAMITFKIRKEAADFVIDVKITDSAGGDLDLVNSGDGENDSKVLPAKPARKSRLMISQEDAANWAAIVGSYKLIVKENGKEIFTGTFKTSVANEIKEDEWTGLNKTEGKPEGITFKGAFKQGTSDAIIEFDPKYTGVMSLEIIGWY